MDKEARQNTVDLQKHRQELRLPPIKQVDCLAQPVRERNACSQTDIEVISCMKTEPDHQDDHRNRQQK